MKNKYKKQEVLDLIKENDEKHLKALQEQQEKQNRLSEEIKKLRSELETYKNQEKLKSATIKSAEKEAEEIKKTAELQYLTECEKLFVFKERWQEYFTYLAETYPYYNSVNQAKEIICELNKILGKAEKPIEMIEHMDNVFLQQGIALSKKDVAVSPILATSVSENGFDMSAVLNPGELDLEDLCKELGLMEDE